MNSEQVLNFVLAGADSACVEVYFPRLAPRIAKAGSSAGRGGGKRGALSFTPPKDRLQALHFYFHPFPGSLRHSVSFLPAPSTCARSLITQAAPGHGSTVHRGGAGQVHRNPDGVHPWTAKKGGNVTRKSERGGAGGLGDGAAPRWTA